jgi:tetratricopeptide (TPR) repeat protein
MKAKYGLGSLIILILLGCDFNNTNADLEPIHDLDSLYSSALTLSEQNYSCDPEMALQQAQEALAYAELLTREHLFFPLIQLADLHMRKGSYTEATNYFLTYLKLAEELDSHPKILVGLFNLGALNIELSRFSEAESYYRRMIEQVQALPEKEREQALKKYAFSYSLNLALITTEKGDYKEAEYFFRRANDLLAQSQLGPEKQINYWINYAYYLLKIGDTSKAQECYILCKNLAEEIEDWSSELIANQGLVSCWIKEELWDNALSMALPLYEEALSLGDKKQQLSTGRLLIDIYEAKGQLTEVLQYTRETKNLESELSTAESEKYLLKNELEAQANKQRDEFAKAYSLRIMGMLILLLFSLLFLGYFLIQLRNTKRKSIEEEKAKEKLILELTNKDKKLVTQGLQEIQRESLIHSLIEDFQKEERGSSPSVSYPKAVHKLQSLLVREGWEEFEVRFERVYPDFLANLSQLFPDLTANERRLCAFLRLDMNTKEMVGITGQSIRAIELARIRLRKKLKLTHSNKGLFEFLSEL